MRSVSYTHLYGVREEKRMRVVNFGSLNIDYVYRVDHFVRPGETMSAQSLQVQCLSLIHILQSHDLLPSRLYCRPWSFTKSCLSARGLYRRWGIAPRPEDPDSIDASIDQMRRAVNPSCAICPAACGAGREISKIDQICVKFAQKTGRFSGRSAEALSSK